MVDKITLSNVANLQDTTTAVTTINSNSAIIQTAFDNTLSRDGTTPNQMLSNFDMNSNQILNLPPPASANSPARLADIVSPSTISSVPPVGTSGAVVGLLNANKTDSGNNIYAGNNTFNGTNNVNGTTFFSGPTSFLGSFGIPNNSITSAEFRQSAPLSVVGNSTTSGATITDITGTTRQVLSVNTAGNSLIFAQPRGDQLLGTSTNDNATAGNIGELITNAASVGPIVSGTATNSASISLTAGDWDVWGWILYVLAGTTNITSLITSIGTTSGVINAGNGAYTQLTTAATVPGGNITHQLIPLRVSLASTTTYFLVSQCTFTVSTVNLTGVLNARRVR